jgi:broad specificity phosphatase PhoE
MTKLLLIRHGENDFLKHHKLPGQLPGIHLNKRGLEQADLLAETLKALPIKAIYSSPLERAVETAAPLARVKNLDIQQLSDLMDTDVGRWAGRSLSELRRSRQWKILQNNLSNFQFPEGETIQQVQDRVMKIVQKMVSTNKNETVVIVSHADPIRLAIAFYLGIPIENFQKITISPGSVTIIHSAQKITRLLAMNLISPFNPQPLLSE